MCLCVFNILVVLEKERSNVKPLHIKILYQYTFGSRRKKKEHSFKSTRFSVRFPAEKTSSLLIMFADGKYITSYKCDITQRKGDIS